MPSSPEIQFFKADREDVRLEKLRRLAQMVTAAQNRPNPRFQSKGYAVANLPAGAVGDRAHVTDANATTFNSIVAGGGANVVPVFFNGTNWVIG